MSSDLAIESAIDWNRHNDRNGTGGRNTADIAVSDHAIREQLFIAVVESSNDAIVTKTLDGTITSWNRAAERLFGYTAHEAIGQSINIIVPPELREEVRGILGSIRNGEKVEHHETWRVSKDGRRVDVSLSVSPVTDSSGAIIGAAKVARDISARRKAQKDLRASEQMARDIIAGALDPFVQIDRFGNVSEWNPRAEELFGWTRCEVLGKSLSDLGLLGDYQPHIPNSWRE